jgi:hypothetical protein
VPTAAVVVRDGGRTLVQHDVSALRVPGAHAVRNTVCSPGVSTLPVTTPGWVVNPIVAPTHGVPSGASTSRRNSPRGPAPVPPSAPGRQVFDTRPAREPGT